MDVLVVVEAEENRVLEDQQVRKDLGVQADLVVLDLVGQKGQGTVVGQNGRKVNFRTSEGSDDLRIVVENLLMNTQSTKRSYLEVVLVALAI